MARRMLDTVASERMQFTREDWISSIAQSEGRVLACESVCTMGPMIKGVTNAEVCASMGADILLLNIFDVDHPTVLELPQVDSMETIREVKRLTGRMIGINLEPVPEGFESTNAENGWKISTGRKALLSNAKKAVEMGVDMILLTGNPGNGVSNEDILKTLRSWKQELGNSVVLAAGKMHASEVLSEGGENIITEKDVKAFIEAGADVVLMPAPGTVPGITMEYIRSLTRIIHDNNRLAMTAIGTSQEGAEVETVREIALMCKMAGVDIHHLGDAGLAGMSMPENIIAYSKTIRGIVHTYRRMASSVNR